MRIVIQRVISASVKVDAVVKGAVGKGMMILVGVEEGDIEADVQWLASKTASLRIFDDENGVMNKNIVEAGGHVLAISQFTLTASTRKGNRPSYIRAARPESAVKLYNEYCDAVAKLTGTEVAKGVFGADMKVELINDGPVTIIIDSRLRE